MSGWTEALRELVAVTEPPGHPSCSGDDPALYLVTRQADAGPALAVCATCPPAVRAWCLEAVRPRPSLFDGVAGGVLWRNGKPVAGPDLEEVSA